MLTFPNARQRAYLCIALYSSITKGVSPGELAMFVSGSKICVVFKFFV